MSATAAMLVHTWAVGKRYRVTMTVPRLQEASVSCATCEWEPDFPGRLTPQEAADYISGRQVAMRLIAGQITAKKNQRNPDHD